MAFDYDIFRRLTDGTKLWVCAVASVQEARTRLRALVCDDPGTYYLCDLRTRAVLGTATPEDPDLHVAEGEDVFRGTRSASGSGVQG